MMYFFATAKNTLIIHNSLQIAEINFKGLGSAIWLEEIQEALSVNNYVQYLGHKGLIL